MRLLAFVVLLPSFAAAQADLILHNGKVVTVDQQFSIRQAVAVRSGRITAVGSDAEILKQRAAATTVIDLKGRTVVPGLIDSHVHALGAGLSEFRAPLPPLDSFAAIQNYIRAQAAKTPKGDWIVVPRTFPTRLKEMRMPTREVLDVAPEHLVMFDASYTVVVNTAALKKCGITRDTANPPRGEIVKDATGEPNGILKNAQKLLKGLPDSAQFSEEEKLTALEQMLKRYAAAGLTAVSDRAVTSEDIALYRKLHAQNKLPVRVVMTWRLDAAPPVETLVQQIQSAPFTTGTGDSWLKFGAFKVTMDGGMTIGTAYQRVPYGEFGEQLYGQTNKDDRGQLFIAPPKLQQIFAAARNRGWQLTAHCQGGGAVDNFLSAMETLNLAESRSHLMHSSFQSLEAIARAKRLGVDADIQMPWLYYDAPALTRVFGESGMRYFIPLKSYLEAGVKIAAGSDHMIGHNKNRAVNPYNPFTSMWTAVTRKTSHGSVVRPEQRISREDALRMHTIWAAWMQHADHERGSIEPGKLADLVVIDRDYLTAPEDEIRRIEPQITIVDGRLIRGGE